MFFEICFFGSSEGFGGGSQRRYDITHLCCEYAEQVNGGKGWVTVNYLCFGLWPGLFSMFLRSSNSPILLCFLVDGGGTLVGARRLVVRTSAIGEGIGIERRVPGIGAGGAGGHEDLLSRNGNLQRRAGVDRL